MEKLAGGLLMSSGEFGSVSGVCGKIIFNGVKWIPCCVRLSWMGNSRLRSRPWD